MSAQPKIDYQTLDDLNLATQLSDRDPGAAREITRRNNQRLFRTAWSISRNRAEAEDIVQAAYLKAFAAIGGFAGQSSLSTWLTRIVINEALERRRGAVRRAARLDGASIASLDEYREKLMAGSSTPPPDSELARAQLRQALEAAIAQLPDEFRLVFVLRAIEGLSVEETSSLLGVAPATVKTRLLRARRRLQQALAPEIRSALEGAFPFAGVDCEALTERVLAKFRDPSTFGDADHD